MAHAWSDYAILFAVGGIAGTVNVLAGGGSFLTLPVMIFLGLPATLANGTNRVGILVQNVGAVWGFHRHRLVEWAWLRLLALPALAGVVVGTWAAVRVGDVAFQRILAVFMVGAALWTVWDPLRHRQVGERMRSMGRGGRVALVAAFFVIGVYGGFVQAGAGFLILAATTVAGLDLVRGNALKVLITLAFTPLALTLFALGGHVDWGMGAALAAGTLSGGLAGVRLTVLKGHAWVKRVVVAAIVVFAVRLWLAP